VKNHLKLSAIVLALTSCSLAHGGDADDGEPLRPHFLARLGPRGGWNPDGRGMFHWWNPHCYPQACGPDDYCRKPMPNVCRPWPNTLVGPGTQPQPTPQPQPQPTPPAPTYSP
jgi:hypothetical protein